jgi:hypothetical protein
MLEGIEVLDTVIKIGHELRLTPVAIWMFIISGGLLIALIILCVCMQDDIDDWVIATFVVPMVICGWIGFTCVIFGTPVETTQYKVLIHDSVSMTEFSEHYEIVDQEGKIYVIQEIQHND